MALFDRSAADNLDVTDSTIRNGGVTTSYQYTLSIEPLNGAVNSDDLVLEIRQSAIVTALDYVNTDEGGDRLEIVFKAALSGAVALAATYTWNTTTAVLCSDTSEVVAGEWIRQDADGQWFEILSINPDVSVSILNPDALSIPAGATQSSKGGDIRRLQGNQHEPCTPGSILGDHEGAAEPQAEVSGGSVLDTTLATPPGSPTIDDRYIVAASGTGDWSGHDDDIAEWDGTSWIFETPIAGVSRYSEGDNQLHVFDGVEWKASPYRVKGKVLIVDQNDPQADYTTVQSAIDAAVADDTVLVFPGLYVEAITMKASVTVMGAGGPSGFGFQPPVRISSSFASAGATVTNTVNGARLININVAATWSGSTGTCAALSLEGTGRMYAQGCQFTISSPGASGGNAYGMYMGAGSSLPRFEHCGFTASGNAAKRVGVYHDAIGGKLNLFNCNATGVDFGIEVDRSTADLELGSCRVSGGLEITSGDEIELYGDNQIDAIGDTGNKVTWLSTPWNGLPEKTTLVAGDRLTVADSAASYAVKQAALSALPFMPFNKILTVDPTSPGADYTTISAAVAAASAGDVVLVGPGTYSEQVVVNAAITIQGAAGSGLSDTPATKILYATSTDDEAALDPTSAGAIFKDLHVVLQWEGSAGRATAVRCGASFEAHNCFFEQTVNGASGGSGYAFLQDGLSGASCFNCRFDAVGAYTHYGYYADSFGYSAFYDCIFEGTDAAIFADSASTQFGIYGGQVVDDIELTAASSGSCQFYGVAISGTITDPNDAMKVRSLPLDEVPQKAVPVDADRVLVYDSEDEPNHKAVQVGNLGVGTGLLGGSWSFSTTITDADPGSKNFRLNNATQASATFIYVSDTADSGVDASTILNNLSSGDRVYIQESKDATRYHLCVLTGAPTDATGYVKLPITVESSGADLTNNKKCVFLFAFTGGGTANAVTAAAVITDNAVVRGDGGSRGVQSSGITVNDTDQIASIETATFNTVHDNGNLGATPTINFNLGQKQKGTISANITAITFTAPPGPGNFMLELTENGTGGFTLPASAWPATVITGNGDTPDIDTSANARNLFAVYYDGTNYWLSWGKQGWVHPT